MLWNPAYLVPCAIQNQSQAQIKGEVFLGLNGQPKNLANICDIDKRYY